MKIRFRHSGRVLSWLVRGIASTLDICVTDKAGLLHSRPRSPLIWAFWHNRLFLIPYIKESWQPHIPGCILTSPSGDGQIIADLCAEFGLEAARGSSSKPEKGMSALIKLADRVKNGYDIGITPDGPRGPRYVLGPGLLKLAQLTGAGIMPIHVRYESAWEFPTWDGFLLPKPFSRVHISLGKIQSVPRRMSEEEFSSQLQQLQQVMRAEVE
jgi:Kdo2-lipid IVA 3' secondary acyltransferase